MNLNNLTAKIGEVELEAIIMDAVKKKTGLEVLSVSFNIGTRSVGYGTSEHDEHYFEGAIVTFANGQTIKSAK